jgi:hypothetical protein
VNRLFVCILHRFLYNKLHKNHLLILDNIEILIYSLDVKSFFSKILHLFLVFITRNKPIIILYIIRPAHRHKQYPLFPAHPPSNIYLNTDTFD